MKIHTRMRLTDLLVTVISAGFLSPRSVTFEGIIVAPGASPSAAH